MRNSFKNENSEARYPHELRFNTLGKIRKPAKDQVSTFLRVSSPHIVQCTLIASLLNVGIRDEKWTFNIKKKIFPYI